MTSIKVNFEIGHLASPRSKKTPEGFTHDWEVFVRGQEGADISHFVDKVVFHLHETFPKPRRVVKEPPFSIKESGYAGFMFPIDIYMKNKDEPKKISFVYDFTLQRSGSLKDRYVFQNPNDDFKKKLLRGGGIPVSNDTFYTNPDQENRSRDSFPEEKQQLVSKPKLSSDTLKKHKSKEHKEEVPHRTNNFETLFGPPLQKPPKVSPDPKKVNKIPVPIKSDKKEKDRSSSDKKAKHEHKEPKVEKIKIKEEKEKPRLDKIKTEKTEKEKSKDKASKRHNERPPSPEPAKKRCMSPVMRTASPTPRSNSAAGIKEAYKSTKHGSENIEPKKPKIPDEKVVECKVDKEIKEKKKKEKKSHDRDKERKEKKDHKKESHKIKEPPKEIPREIPKDSTPKIRDVPKEKEGIKESPPVKEKPTKSEKLASKFSIENLRKTPPPEIEEHTESRKSKDKNEPEKKHKHKKKDKKRDESKEKHKETTKDKKHKHERNHDFPLDKSEVVERRETPISKECIPEPGSPISIDTASQCSSKSGIAKNSLIGTEDANSDQSDSESSIMGDEIETKIKIENPSPEPVKREPSPEPEPEVEQEPELEVDPKPVAPSQPKDKSKKHKDKSAKKEEKRRKRKAAEDEEGGSRKVARSPEILPTCNGVDHDESTDSTPVETKVQDNGVSSSLGEEPEPGEISPSYMVQLLDLQQRIMKIKSNEELERVVNLIAETGRYEVTTQTFDFDLCLLDRSTVQQLIQLVGC